MTRDERFQLYEKLYFHEIERREKINARLSLPLAAVLANVGLLSFLLNSQSRPAGLLGATFWLLLAASTVALLTGAWFFRKAWFGHTDKLLPTADQIEAYHATLVNTYDDFKAKDALVEEHFGNFLFDYYKRFSSANAVNNDQRSYNVYRANAALTAAVLLALAAAMPFYLPHSNATSSPTETSAMAEEKVPPPPPPPPPERLVKGDTPQPPPPPPPTQRR